MILQTFYKLTALIISAILTNLFIQLNYRVEVDGPCDMDLSFFPMDVQECTLIFESYSYNKAEVLLNWMVDKPVSFSQVEFFIPEFRLVAVKEDKQQYSYTAGIWDQLVVRFYFKRMFRYYILQVAISKDCGECYEKAWGVVKAMLSVQLQISALSTSIKPASMTSTSSRRLHTLY